jgi:hypothetical protein
MTKAEAIKATEYTEADLIDLALLCAKDKFSTLWHKCEHEGDMYDAEHYMNLTLAFKAMREELQNK